MRNLYNLPDKDLSPELATYLSICLPVYLSISLSTEVTTDYQKLHSSYSNVSPLTLMAIIEGLTGVVGMLRWLRGIVMAVVCRRYAVLCSSDCVHGYGDLGVGGK